MTRNIDRGLRSPTNRGACERGEESIRKFHVFTQVVVAEVDVAAARRLDVAHDLIHGSLAIYAVIDRRDRAVLTHKRTTARRLHWINDDAILLDQIVTRHGQTVDVR